MNFREEVNCGSAWSAKNVVCCGGREAIGINEVMDRGGHILLVVERGLRVQKGNEGNVLRLAESVPH